MDKRQSLEETISTLQDNLRYMIFLTGSGRYNGSFRIDNTLGSEIKQLHLVFELYDKAEIYQNTYDPGTELYDSVLNTILHKIEHAIKETYYRRDDLKDSGMKGDISFYILQITEDGKYKNEELDGDKLSGNLKSLIKNSKTLTILEKGSNAYRILQKTMRSTGKIKIHNGDIYLSEMSPQERSKYRLGDDYKSDPFESPDNVIEHHKD